MKFFQSLLICNGIVAGFKTSNINGKIIFKLIYFMVPKLFDKVDFNHNMTLILWYSSAIEPLRIFV